MESEAKKTSALREALEHEGPSKLLRVAVAVQVPPVVPNLSLSSKQRMHARKARFDDFARGVVDAITSTGGAVEELGWSNSIVYALLAKPGVDAVAELDEVHNVDLAGTVNRQLSPMPR